ncbi:hypothetical protein LR48_Vigan07g110700 [Vigna angularis]|uniref:Uncharacterized protein n=1 Tax=Phaseolus angularis TaxID=3914 RepID=A0A0L9UXB4_PHAAN|nr:hypothetical protein LR48_Vigan07g110700 [Vigna angularis]
MESEKTSKSVKGEVATTAERQFTVERHSGTHVGSAEGKQSELGARKLQLLEGLDESRRRRRIRTSRELFPSPETLLQPSPQSSDHSIEEMENNNIRRTLVDYTNVAGPQHFNNIVIGCR